MKSKTKAKRRKRAKRLKRPRPMKPQKPLNEEAQKFAEAYLWWELAMRNAIDQKEAALAKLLAIAPPGSTFNVMGVMYTIVDNYASKNTAWKSVASKRFDLKATN